MRRARLLTGALLVLAASACGGGESASAEDEVKETVTEFLEAAIAGDNGRACAMTTHVDDCLSGLMLAQGFLGEGGFEAVLGDDWREQIENAEVTFTDDSHASLPPLTPDEEGPTELVREDGEWRIVVEEEATADDTTTEDTDEQYAEFTEEARDVQADVIELVREIDVTWTRATLGQVLGDSLDSWDVLAEALESDNAISADEFSQAALAVADLKARLTESEETSEGTTTTEAAPSSKPKPKTGAASWSAEAVEPYTTSPRDVYRLSRQLCSVFTAEQVADEYDAASSSASSAAHAYAQTSYQPPFRPAAEAGCLAGLRAG